jgi:hypothetical protein
MSTIEIDCDDRACPGYLVSILDDIATASVMVLTRPDAVNLADSMAVCERIGDAISEVFPDRAYFVEVWQNGRRGFAQVFQPFGVPRNR